jgi:hypothetical protein
MNSKENPELLAEKISGDYKNLLDILQTVLKSNNDLIKILDRNHE